MALVSPTSELIDRYSKDSFGYCTIMDEPGPATTSRLVAASLSFSLILFAILFLF